VSKNNVIPFKYYGRFILVSILIVVAISIVVYTNFINDNKYNFPFVKYMKDGKEITRIYPAASFDRLVSDSNPITFDKTKLLINKSFSYNEISDYSFGKIDHYTDDGIYKIYDRFDHNFMTMYEKDNKIIGFTYEYIFNKSATSEFPEREYIYQDVVRLERIMGKNYTVESGKTSKSFIAKGDDNLVYVFTIIADDITDNTLGDIVSKNKDISLNISIFNNMESYGGVKLFNEK